MLLGNSRNKAERFEHTYTFDIKIERHTTGIELRFHEINRKKLSIRGKYLAEAN